MARQPRLSWPRLSWLSVRGAGSSGLASMSREKTRFYLLPVAEFPLPSSFSGRQMNPDYMCEFT
jgi:hypothetical protein